MEIAIFAAIMLVILVLGDGDGPKYWARYLEYRENVVGKKAKLVAENKRLQAQVNANNDRLETLETIATAEETDFDRRLAKAKKSNG